MNACVNSPKNLYKKLSVSGTILLFIFLLLPCKVLSASASTSQDNTLSINVKKNSSLGDLVSASGYEIEDENMTAFLSEFMALNPDIHAISIIEAGSVVLLPLAYLNKVRDNEMNRQNTESTSAAAYAPPASPQQGTAEDAGLSAKTEMGRFNDREMAGAFLNRLLDSGYKGIIEQQKGSNGQSAYLVYVLLPAAAAEAGADDVTWSLLGTRGKHLHGALTLTGIFTDNAFNTKKNRKSDFSLLLTPEIWLNLPRTDKAVSYENISPRSAGGHLLDTLMGERLFGYQASLYYRTDLPLTRSKTSPFGSTPTHKLAAGLTFTGNRLSLNIFDQFEKSYQEREGGQIIQTNVRNRYDANRFNAELVYDTRNRFIFSLDYVNFMAKNSNTSVKDLDRHDYGLTPAVRYRLSSRINLLAEYTYYVVSYDRSRELDSKEHYFMGGLEWRFTEKTFGQLKAGMETKNFRHNGRYRGFSAELQMEQRLSPKTQLSLSVYRKTNESSVFGTAYTVSTGARLTLSHMITSKITAAAKLSYLNDRHKGRSLAGLSETVVNDHIYQAGLEVQYSFRRWLRARAEYFITIKDSSDPSFDYRANTLLLSLTGAF